MTPQGLQYLAAWGCGVMNKIINGDTMVAFWNVLLLITFHQAVCIVILPLPHPPGHVEYNKRWSLLPLHVEGRLYHHFIWWRLIRIYCHHLPESHPLLSIIQHYIFTAETYWMPKATDDYGIWPQQSHCQPGNEAFQEYRDQRLSAAGILIIDPNYPGLSYR